MPICANEKSANRVGYENVLCGFTQGIKESEPWFESHDKKPGIMLSVVSDQ